MLLLLGALRRGVVAVVAAAALLVPPPWTVITSERAAAFGAAAFFPLCPISTPSPMASSSTPTKDTSVAPDDRRGVRGAALERVRVDRTSVTGSAFGKVDWPRRSPHWTQ